MFCAAEKTFNEEVTELLESSGYSVFLPQRDGTEVLTDDMTEEQKALAIFDADRSEIEKADALVMVLDGRVPDEGACVELGIAYALGKPCYGVRTDVRAAERGMDVNPMLTGCFRRIFRFEDKGEAFGELKAFIAAHGL